MPLIGLSQCAWIYLGCLPSMTACFDSLVFSPCELRCIPFCLCIYIYILNIYIYIYIYIKHIYIYIICTLHTHTCIYAVYIYTHTYIRTSIDRSSSSSYRWAWTLARCRTMWHTSLSVKSRLGAKTCRMLWINGLIKVNIHMKSWMFSGFL